jgi:hypothetical protein
MDWVPPFHLLDLNQIVGQLAKRWDVSDSLASFDGVAT